MTEPNAFVSPEYPVLFTVLDPGTEEGPGDLLASGSSLPFTEPGAGEGVSPPSGETPSLPPGYAGLSLALLVNGIPSFLATVPVAEEQLPELVGSLGKGDVRVAVVGVSVDGSEIPGGDSAQREAWQIPEDEPPLPAAFLSLVCTDGRRIGVARIVARRESASPEEVARYVMKQITRGVQVPDLASAG